MSLRGLIWIRRVPSGRARTKDSESHNSRCLPVSSGLPDQKKEDELGVCAQVSTAESKANWESRIRDAWASTIGVPSHREKGVKRRVGGRSYGNLRIGRRGGRDIKTSNAIKS